MRIIVAITTIMITLVTSTAVAQVSKDDSLGVYRLDEILVTATRLSLTTLMLPFSCEVVSCSQMDLTDANSAIDAIALLAGVLVQRTGDFGRSDPYIRGLGDMGRRIGILVDGHPVKMGLFGCTITHALPLSNISRIEVIRSPSSVLYGSDALGGVINIVTSPMPSEENIRAQTCYGSFGTIKYNILNANRIGSLGYTIALDHRQTEGHLDNSAYEGNDFSSKIVFDHHSTKVSFFAKYFDGRKEEPARLIPYDSTSNVWNDYARGAVDLELTQRIGETLLSFKAYDEFGHHRFSDGWNSKDRSLGMTLYASSKLANRGELGMGIDLRWLSGKRLSSPVGEWDKSEFGGYGLTKVNLSDRMSATLGLRLSWDEVSGSIFSPHLGFLLQPSPQTRLRIATAKGYRSPQINELYMFPSSNKSLSAETVWSYEIGLDQQIGKIASVSITGFVLKGKDFIDLAPVDNPPPKFRFENIGQINFGGIESAIQIRPVRWLKSSLSYSYLDTNGKTKGRPEDKADLEVELDLVKTKLSLFTEVVADYYAENHKKQKIPDYAVTDLKVSRSISRHAWAFAMLKNVFDEQYQVYVEIPSNPGVYKMPGRRYLVGLSFEWSKR